MSEQLQALKKLFQYLVFALSCLLGLLLFSFFVRKGINQIDSQSVSIDKGWTIRINDTEYNNVDISEFSFSATGIGDVITMENTLPPINWDYPVLRVDAWYCVIDVFVSGEHLFSYGAELYEKRRNVGTGYHLVSLDQYEAGSPVTIVLQVTEPNAFRKLQSVCVDRAGSSIAELWKERGFAFCSSLFFIIVGVFLFMLGIAWTIRDKRNFRLLIVGSVSFSIGLVSFYDNDCAVLFFRNYELNTWANHVALYICNISMLLLLYTTMTERILDKLVIRAYLIFFTVYMSMAIMLDAHHIVHLVSSRTLMMTFFFFEVVSAIVICLLNILSNSGGYRIPSIGFLCMVAFIGLDLLRYNVVKRIEIDTSAFNGTMVCIGAMAFLVSVFLNFYKEYSGLVKKTVDTVVAKQYQSMDYDTGLLAMHAKPEILKAMKDSGLTRYIDITIRLDVDEYVRTQSPMVIENLIWVFARVLQKTFTRAYVFRGSGASFEIIMMPDMVRATRYLDKMKEDAINARQPSMTKDFEYSVEIQTVEMPRAIEARVAQ